MSEDANYEQMRYEQYAKQRADLESTTVTLSERFDKWSLTLAGGALAVSLTFLEKIAPHPAANTAFLLGLAWVFLIGSLVSAFVSLLTAPHAVLKRIEFLDAEYAAHRAAVEKNEPDPPLPQNPNLINKVTAYLNIVALVLFVAGVFCLCCFAYSNLPVANPCAGISGTNVITTVTNK